MSRPVCEECGYDVSGLGDGQQFRCPECGAPCDPVTGFKLEPRPPAWRIAWRLLGPGALYALFVWASLTANVGRIALFTAWPLLIGVWVMLGIGLPLDYARALAARTRVRPDRHRFVVALTTAAAIANLFLIAAAIRLAF